MSAARQQIGNRPEQRGMHKSGRIRTNAVSSVSLRRATGQSKRLQAFPFPPVVMGRCCQMLIIELSYVAHQVSN